MGVVVDVHTHFLPREFLDLALEGEGPTGIEVQEREGADPLVVHSNGLRYPVFPLFQDPQAKLKQMDEDGIDVSIVSIVPSLFMYWLEPAETSRVCSVVNDAAASFAARAPGRIYGMATVPMNDPHEAAQELQRARSELGLVGVEIGTSVGSRQLDSQELDSVFDAAGALEMPVMLHPYISMITPPEPGVEGFHLSNAVGNPFETTVAASRLIVGGVFDRHPTLRILLVHGGGFVPYQLGRLGHAYEVREETKSVAAREPREYVENLLFDTITYERRSLELLLDFAGAERVLFGTDIPFDMGDTSGLRLREWGKPKVADQVLGENALRLFGVTDRREKTLAAVKQVD